MKKAMNRQIVPLGLTLAQKLKTLLLILYPNPMVVVRHHQNREMTGAARQTELHLLLNLMTRPRVEVVQG